MFVPLRVLRINRVISFFETSEDRKCFTNTKSSVQYRGYCLETHICGCPPPNGNPPLPYIHPRAGLGQTKGEVTFTEGETLKPQACYKMIRDGIDNFLSLTFDSSLKSPLFIAYSIATNGAMTRNSVDGSIMRNSYKNWIFA